MRKYFLFQHLRQDLPASIVVFLVALPLCLGIALASGAEPITGLIAGIIGGVVVGAASGSTLGVSGPAAGLAVIVLNGIGELGSYELFLGAVIIAGVLQIVLGLLRAGVLAYYFPNSVIKGMLSGIGIIIFLKQIPHAVGYNRDYEGDLDFVQPDKQNTFSELLNMGDFLNTGSIIIAAVALAILLIWELPKVKGSKLGLVPGPLLAVISGIFLGLLFQGAGGIVMDTSFFIDLPELSLATALEVLPSPDLSGFGTLAVWKLGATIAVVASLETLLCVEATDKLDPYKRVTPTNRELLAQGTGNMLSGLIGGLPITQVIVRSSANIQSGGRTKLSAIIHGFMLLVSVLVFPDVLRAIPLASLAAILLLVGYKLTKPANMVQMWQKGPFEFIPYAVTILGVVFSDLLTGVMIGMGVGIFFILYNNYRLPFHIDSATMEPGKPLVLQLSEDVSFLNKAGILRTLNTLPKGAHVVVDASRSARLHPDVVEIIEDQITRGKQEDITIELIGLDRNERTKSSRKLGELMRQAKKMSLDKD